MPAPADILALVMPSRVLVLILPLLALPARAHDLWIERDGPLHTLSWGHEHATHAGAKVLDYKPENVREAICFNGAGREVDAQRGHGHPATLKGDCAASWFFISSGYWSKTPYGTKNLPKQEAGAVIESWLSVEGVKRIDQWSADLERALTRHLELAPLENPLKLKTGEKLHLRVWFQGKPAAGIHVAYFGQPRGVSDSEGKVNIRLRNPGFQLIQASMQLPLDDARADKVVHGSSLQFELR
jgi:nickel transport protein